MTRHAPISRIYHMADAPAPTGQEAEARNQAAREQAWHGLGIVVLDPEDVASEWLRAALIAEAETRYGRRRHRRRQHGD
ncbi:hypothetical protein [Tranquillimonas rosea]|uniref:hypothetical protein n=1 Tax=Tranquillimonas rosea TaxID=641238 RepID=UPI003BA85859